MDVMKRCDGSQCPKLHILRLPKDNLVQTLTKPPQDQLTTYHMVHTGRCYIVKSSQHYSDPLLQQSQQEQANAMTPVTDMLSLTSVSSVLGKSVDMHWLLGRIQ